jgi:hypothetical protein
MQLRVCLVSRKVAQACVMARGIRDPPAAEYGLSNRSPGSSSCPGPNRGRTDWSWSGCRYVLGPDSSGDDDEHAAMSIAVPQPLPCSTQAGYRLPWLRINKGSKQRRFSDRASLQVIKLAIMCCRADRPAFRTCAFAASTQETRGAGTATPAATRVQGRARPRSHVWPSPYCCWALLLRTESGHLH